MKKVRMKTSVGVAGGALSKGDEVDVSDRRAASWVASGTAVDITPDDYEPDDGGGDQADGDGLDKLKVGELRERLESSGQPTEGKKADLVARLRAIQPDTDGDGDADGGDQADGDDGQPSDDG